LPGLAADDNGNLYVSDRGGHVIQRISLATAAVTTLAGALGVPGSDDGVGTAAHFRVPTGLAFDGHGRLLVADSGNSTIRQIDLTSGQVTTLVGIPNHAKVQPGALPGGLNCPERLAVLPNGDIMISDFNENALLLVH
jgi:DNA-binding beta-propeller fold protein YncE